MSQVVLSVSIFLIVPDMLLLFRVNSVRIRFQFRVNCNCARPDNIAV